MASIIDQLAQRQLKQNLVDFGAGDTIRVHQLIQEGSKERVQVFEGVVLRRNGGGIDETFTVRKISYNVGVERIFPLHSPRVSKIEVKQRGKVRRARLYYLRELSGKAARIEQVKESAKDREARLAVAKVASKGPIEKEIVAESAPKESTEAA